MVFSIFLMAIILVAAGAGAYAYFYIYQTHPIHVTTSTTACPNGYIGPMSNYKCLEYFPMGPFSFSVNYTGRWTVSYVAANAYSPRDLNGTFSGTGYNSTSISYDVEGCCLAQLCVTATKQDASDQTLILTVTNGMNETSLPHGSVSLCSSGFGI